MTDLFVVDFGDLVPTDQQASANPVAVYLSSLQSLNSRATMRRQLVALAAMLNHSGKEIELVPWHLLRIHHVRTLVARLGENRSTATANLMLSALRGVLNACHELELIPGEDYFRMAKVKNLKGNTLDAATGRMLTRAELAALFRACAEDMTIYGRRDAAIIALNYAAGGLRRAEVVGLDLADFEPRTGMLTIRGKGNKTRNAYVKGNARIALDDWLEVRGRNPGPLFPRYQSGGTTGAVHDRLSPQAIYRMYKSRADQAGVEEFSPHDIRRTFISDQLDAGTDVVLVARLVGHADPKTTARYDRRGERAKEEAADAIHVPYRRREDH